MTATLPEGFWVAVAYGVFLGGLIALLFRLVRPR